MNTYNNHSLTNSPACSTHSIMKTAVIYARYSSDSQTEQSIEGQLRVCTDYAKSNGITILDTYIDRAMTGTNDKRPDFQRMLQDSKKKLWNYVLVYKFDRFSRNIFDTTIYEHELSKNGVKLLSAMENIPDAPEGIILKSLLQSMNHYYSDELSQKVKRGMRETRLKGLFQGGQVLYGYRVENRKLVPDETTSEIVKYIFTEYSKGKLAREIVSDLKEKGITKNSKPFDEKKVFKILKNECYIGKYEINGEEFNNIYPKIIDDELFNLCQSRKRVNKIGKNSIKTDYLLRKKLICGYCGYSICGESGTAKSGKIEYYYKCLNRKHKSTNCRKEILRKDFLEKLILDSIIEKLSKEEFIEQITNEIMKIQNSGQKSTLSLLIKNKNQIELTLGNIMSAVEKGIVTKTTKSRMIELETQLEELEKKILIEKVKEDVKIPKEEVKKYLKESLLLQPKELIQALIKTIVVYDDKIEITFNTPIEKNPENKTPGSFYLCKITKNLTNYIDNIKQEYTIDIEFYV